MRVTTDYEVFHRTLTSGDMPEVDVETNDTTAQNLNGEGNFQIEADSSVDYTTSHKTQDDSEAIIGTAAIASFIFIKNTGYRESGKTTATTDVLAVGFGESFDTGGTGLGKGFTLEAGESICFHGLGGDSDNLDDFFLHNNTSASDIYVEVVYN